MKRRKRLPDGSLGELEEVFESSTLSNEELQQQLLDLQNYMLQKEMEDLLNQGGM